MNTGNYGSTLPPAACRPSSKFLYPGCLDNILRPKKKEIAWTGSEAPSWSLCKLRCIMHGGFKIELGKVLPSLSGMLLWWIGPGWEMANKAVESSWLPFPAMFIKPSCLKYITTARAGTASDNHAMHMHFDSLVGKLHLYATGTFQTVAYIPIGQRL